MRIIWELRETPLTFRELQASCGGVSPTVLNDRLKALQAAKLLQRDSSRGYILIDSGQDLVTLYEPLNQWTIAWRATL